jgi:ATP-dependent protease ClpP protease subunit
MSRTPWRTVQRQWALHQGGNNTWYRIRNQISGPTQLHIYDEIGYFGVSAKDLIRDLADVNGPLELHLNSPGGEVHEGIAIYNTLMSRNDVTVMIDGIAASIASVIAMAGNPILIARTAQVMVHDGYAMAIGDAQDFRDQAEVLDKASNLIASVYADHTGKPVGYWREIMKAETWYDSQEAIDAGLADRFIPSSQTRHTTDHRMDDRWDIQGAYKHSPRPDSSQRRNAPGDENDDADHSHDDNGGNGHPDNVTTYKNRIVYAWDAADAMSTCHSAADFRHVCAGERSEGDPDTAAHWALPHHTSPSAGPDKGGVTAALARINQTQGLKNKDAALAHLKAHEEALGLPSGEPDNSLSNPLGLTEEELQKFRESIRL